MDNEYEINEFCGFCDNTFDTLLDVYQMKDWGMSWLEFITVAYCEFGKKFAEWLDMAKEQGL